jgi:Aminoglycoside-2''-adenylyltransferase
MSEAGDYAFLWAWEPLHPDDLGRLLFGFERPWWICGGWALALFLDRETRRHDDLDAALLRRDQLALYDHLRGWDLRYATPEHALERWDGRRLDPPIHGIWARRSDEAAAPWTCEFLLNEEGGGYWIYGRDHAVTRPLDEIGMDRNGVPFLCPEIVLLYKSSERWPKNDADFAAVEPYLSQAAALWLHGALAACDAQHPWLARLSHARSQGMNFTSRL